MFSVPSNEILSTPFKIVPDKRFAGRKHPFMNNAYTYGDFR